MSGQSKTFKFGDLVTEAGGDDAKVLNTAKDDDENVKDNEDQIGNIVHPV